MPLRAALATLAVIGGLVALSVFGSTRSDSPVATVESAAAALPRPTVGFTRPAAGASVSGKIPVVVRVSQTPAISRVEFRVDGKLRWTDRRRPYTMYGDTGRLDTATLSVGAHKLTATAVATNGTRDVATRSIKVTRAPAAGGTGGGTAPPPSSGGGGGGTTPGTDPAVRPLSNTALGLRVASASGSTITLAWNAISGATSYGVYLNGRRLTDVGGTGYQVTGLSCGVTYRLLVDTVAADGSRSAKVTISAATQACAPASYYLSPNGNDGASCSASSPCRTLDRGYKVARPGQTVELAAGSYPGGTISGDSSKNGSTTPVVLRPAANAAVTVTGELTVNAQAVEIRSMKMAGGWKTEAGAANVIMRDLDALHMFILSSQNVTVIGGSVGPGVDYHPIIGASNSTPPRNIVVEGVLFHDWTASNTSIHTECLQIGAGDGITIRGNSFVNCAQTGNLHVSHWGDSPRTRNVTIENNFFSTTIGGYYAVQAYAFDNLLIRNNSASQGFLVMPVAGGMNNVRVVANLAPQPSYGCVAGVQYSYNVWFDGSSPAKCSATDFGARTSNPGFTNMGATDLHISASSPAIGRGSSALGSETDIDGETRGLTGAPDAGADER